MAGFPHQTCRKSWKSRLLQYRSKVYSHWVSAKIPPAKAPQTAPMGRRQSAPPRPRWTAPEYISITACGSPKLAEPEQPDWTSPTLWKGTLLNETNTAYSKRRIPTFLFITDQWVQPIPALRKWTLFLGCMPLRGRASESIQLKLSRAPSRATLTATYVFSRKEGVASIWSAIPRVLGWLEHHSILIPLVIIIIICTFWFQPRPASALLSFSNHRVIRHSPGKCPPHQCRSTSWDVLPWRSSGLIVRFGSRISLITYWKSCHQNRPQKECLDSTTRITQQD